MNMSQNITSQFQLQREIEQSQQSTLENSPIRNYRPLMFSIEGNIGAGKSTFLKTLNNFLYEDIVYFPENVSAWQNIGGQNINLLDMMYKNSLRYGFIFQQYVLLTRLRDVDNLKNENLKQVCFSERSIFSNKEVFMKNFEINNVQTKAEILVYNKWFEFISKKCDYQIDGIIYLRTDSENCLKRCIQRKRPEEKAIDFEFLQQIEQRHDEWLQGVQQYKNIPILEIDSNQDFLNDIQIQQNVVQQVKDFINNQICK